MQNNFQFSKEISRYVLEGLEGKLVFLHYIVTESKFIIMKKRKLMQPLF